MVSRYGVAKEGAVGVAVGVGPMHCLIPHCGGPHHHLSPHHPPNHNHVQTHNHQPPQPPPPVASQQPLSPHGHHIGQMNHGQHQLPVNIGHHHPQQGPGQGQHQQPPPQYRIVTPNPRSDFHVPGQNYGAQPVAQVAGGGGSLGVPGGRGPPLGGIPQIGQATPGLQPGGPAGGQQQPPQQPPSAGVQQQQQQGPPQTTTPPVHTPSPQDMSKQAHMQAQPPPSLQQHFAPNQTRPAAPNFYPMLASRPTQGRSLHRGNQGGAPHVTIPVTSTGQPSAIYPPNIVVSGTPTMFVPGQVPNLQQPMYSMNSPMQPLLAYPQPQRHHPTHQTPGYFAGYPSHGIMPQNVYGTYSQGHQAWNFYGSHAQPTPSVALRGASNNGVAGGGQNVGNPLVGAQGTVGVPQGTLQQQQQPQQQIPNVGLALSQPSYPAHTRGTPNQSSSYQKVPTRRHAIMDIVNPDTGENVAGEIYRSAEASEETKTRESSQPQENIKNTAVAADFAARVAKVASEDSKSSNTPTTTIQKQLPPPITTTIAPTPPSTTTTTAAAAAATTTSISNNTTSKTIRKDTDNQCNNTSVKSNTPSPIQVQSAAAPEKVDCKPAKEATRAKQQQTISNNEPIQITKDNVPSQQSTPSNIESKPIVSDTTAPKTTAASNSSPRRKVQPSATAQPPLAAPVATPEPVEVKKEKKASEKSLNSRGTTPTPNNQTEQQQHLQKNGEANNGGVISEKTADDKPEQKSPDGAGKGNQKQKNNKNKIKGRDLNRKGAEKEGTDMDAFAVPQPVKNEAKSSPEVINNEGLPPKSLPDLPKETSIKEKETLEAKADAEPETPKELDNEKLVKTEINENLQPVIHNHKQTNKEPNSIVEDSNKSSVVEKRVNDVVDNAIVKDVSEGETIIAQNNEENIKISDESCEPSEAKSTSVNEKQNEVEPANETKAKLPVPLALKYQYEEGQWSPINLTGKKCYGRDFLLKLQEDSQSRARPSNIVEAEVVLKDITTRQSIRNAADVNMYKGNRTHETLFPGFAKPSFNSKPPPPLNKKSSYQGNKKPQTSKAPVHMTISLREEVKLHEAENAWRPSRLNEESIPQDQSKTDALYKKVRSVLNKLTPQKFDTLVNQVRELDIDTPERLQGVIDLVFEKAVDEPSFSIAYALMCKELSGMKVSTGEKRLDENGKEIEIYVDFRKLILTRCQMMFEKNAVDETAKQITVRLIEKTTDPEKKKELQMNLEDEERRIRMKSVGNIRFIGELYKQDMLVTRIMHTCITHLLATPDEENLECLCKLLTTIGKIFEPKCVPSVFPGYFNQLAELASKKSSKKVSSRVRFMIQDVIDLRANKWIPRRDDSNPKTMDQIQKEAESERLEIQVNNAPMNTPRKDDRNNDRRNRNRGGSSEDGWQTTPFSKSSRQPYSVDGAKLTTKAAPLNEITLGTRNAYIFGGSAAAAKPSPALGTPNKYALLDNLSFDMEKERPKPQLPGSRSTGAREYNRNDRYKTWEGRGSRNGGHMNSSSLSSSRDGSVMEASRSQSMSMPTSSLKYKVPNASSTMPSNPISSNKSVKTEEQLKKIIKDVIDMCNGLAHQPDAFIKDAAQELKEAFDNSSYPLFVQETLNVVLEKGTVFRQQFSSLYAHIINNNMMSLCIFQSEFEKFLEIADDLVIDIPKCFTYFAEVISELVIKNAHPLAELKKTTAELKKAGTCGKLVGELLSKLAKSLGPRVVAEKWDQSGIQWSDLVDTTREDPNNIIMQYDLDFLTSDCNNIKVTGDDLTPDQIRNQLLKLMRDSNFDNITGWINANVGQRCKEPQFIRILVSAILETSTEPCKHQDPSKETWKLIGDKYKMLMPLITRYVDTDPQLELQCLFAIQAYLHKLNHPQGVLGHVIEPLCDSGIISDEAFFSWKDCTDPAEMPGHAVVMTALHSFFVHLKEQDESSEEA